jgi:hypothetical protein
MNNTALILIIVGCVIAVLIFLSRGRQPTRIHHRQPVYSGWYPWWRGSYIPPRPLYQRPIHRRPFRR